MLQRALVHTFFMVSILVLALSVNAQTDIVIFEAGPVRPVALSPSGNLLFVTNVPDGHLEVFDVSGGGEPVPVASIPVGLEPVAVAVIDEDEVWVVNHLSDSVSIVSVSAGRVVRTLLVGDEPRDIVVADPPGATGPRVFISTAHRGQQRTDASIAGVPGAGDPQYTTPGVGRNDVWVFDAADPGVGFGGTPLEILSFFSDTPRALAVSPSGAHVYVAAFHSGNQTATVSEAIVCNGFGGAPACAGDGITSPGGLAAGQMPGGNPGPSADVAGVQAPEVGLIVKWNEASGEFQDESGRNWSNGVRFNLPDIDVFAIDADALGEVATHTHVGTTIFNMVTNPQNGKLYVSNTESINEVRFEGPGIHAGSTVQGHLAESRISVIETPNASSDATGGARHLNKHIDFSVLASNPAFDNTAAGKSLATPLDMAIHHDAGLGTTTLYVAAFGSSKVGIFDVAALEADSFVPDQGQQIGLSAGGPAGLALSADGSTLYVMTRFDNGISVVDTASKTETDHVTFHNPEPASVVAGRPFLYDALATSANGSESCSSCHIFGGMDHLAWDLGNPDDSSTANPMQINFSDLFPLFTPAGIFELSTLNGGAAPEEFHSMKGPMTTQTLKGLVNSGAMHWRGDRSNGAFGINATDEQLSFNNFIVAFSGLVGRPSDLTPTQMQAFTDFALQMTQGPNPNRRLDNSLTADQQAGFDFFFGPRRSDGLVDGALDAVLGPNIEEGFTCDGCHELNPSLGRFGTSTDGTFENETQIFKVSHLRNMYQKVGMFGSPDTGFEIAGGDHTHQGDQIRGFGFLHDGSEDTLERFFRATVFNNAFNQPPGQDTGFTNPAVEIPQMEQFMLVFDSDVAPITGQQITLTSTSGADTDTRLALLIARAGAPFTSEILGGLVTECDLVAKATVAGVPMGWLYTGGAPGSATFDASDGSSTTEAALRTLAASTDITFTCVPAGSGTRMALNRDRDLLLDTPDNCPALANNDQTDTDMDGLGDPCDPTPVPEPAAAMLLFAGIAGLARLHRRRRRRRA